MPGAPTCTMPGSPATINLGRPVEPPDVGAFIAGAVTSGSGESSYAEASKFAATVLRPGCADCSTPTTNAESANSTMA